MIFVSSTNIFGILDDRKIASNANIWTKTKIRRCFWILLFDGIMVENGDEKEEGTKKLLCRIDVMIATDRGDPFKLLLFTLYFLDLINY